MRHHWYLCVIGLHLSNLEATLKFLLLSVVFEYIIIFCITFSYYSLRKVLLKVCKWNIYSLCEQMLCWSFIRFSFMNPKNKYINVKDIEKFLHFLRNAKYIFLFIQLRRESNFWSTIAQYSLFKLTIYLETCTFFMHYEKTMQDKITRGSL